MSRTIAELDYSTWTPEQLARKAALDWRHPLQNVLKGVTPQALEASESHTWHMSARDYGNGLRECAVWRHEPDLQRDLDRAVDFDARWCTVRGEGDLATNSKRNVRRAKQKVRQTCKAMHVNSLWTLTYRAPVTDRELCLRHLKAFRRRVVALLGEWKYLAVLEQQDRGAWHVHLATHALPVRLSSGGVKVKSWDVMRSIWRSVTGELGGNFDEAKRRSRWSKHAKPMRGAGAIASYIAGYVAKDMEASPLNRKRYSVTKGIEIPEAVRAQWGADMRFAELIELAFAAVGDKITRVFFDKQNGVFYVESDDSKSLPS